MKEIENFNIRFKNLDTSITVHDRETAAKYVLLSHLNMTANFLVDASFEPQGSLPEAYLPYTEETVSSLKEESPILSKLLAEYQDHFPPNFIEKMQAQGSWFYNPYQSREENLSRFVQEYGKPLPANLLIEWANFLPGFGFYNRPATEVATREILKKKPKESEAAFVTLPGMDERWSLGLSRHVGKMYQILKQKHYFSPQKPFVCLYVGDANSIARETVSQQLQSHGAFFKNIVLDISPALLTQQQEKRFAENEDFIQGNVLNLSEVLKTPITGFVFAGHELIDDFPVHILLDTQIFGIKEVYFVPKDGEFEYPFGQTSTEILEKFPDFFPWYRFLLKQGLVPVNVNHLILIREINKTLESGYWYLGDYCHSFTWADFISERIPIRALRAKLPIQESVEAILNNVCNLTSDVDPGLFAFAEALGMERLFLGSQGDFLASVLRSVAREKTKIDKRFFENLTREIKEANFDDPTTRRKIQEEVHQVGIWDPDMMAFVFSKNAPNYLS